MSFAESLSKIIPHEITKPLGEEKGKAVPHERKVIIYDQQREHSAFQKQHEARERLEDLELEKAHRAYEKKLKKDESKIPNTHEYP